MTAGATIEVAGPDAVRWAAQLQGVLSAAATSEDSVGPVETDRSAELVTAVIGLAFGAVSTAKTIWDWWSARGAEGVTVRVLLDDGTSIDLSGLDQGQLELAFRKRLEE